MNASLLRPVLIAAFGAIAVTSLLIAEEYPHAYPRKGVTQLFENNRVIIWDVTWLMNVPQPIHRHKYDMAGVFLRWGFINVTTPDGKVNPSGPFEVPRPYYQARGVTHKEEAVGKPGDPERLAIMVDLKEDRATGAVAHSELEPAFPREGAKDVIDNDRVREWDYTWNAKKPVAMHVHERDSVEIFVTGGKIRFKDPSGHEDVKTFAFKDARFIPAGRADSEQAVEGSPRAITIELK